MLKKQEYDESSQLITAYKQAKVWNLQLISVLDSTTVGLGS